jgi:hypothetical protein
MVQLGTQNIALGNICVQEEKHTYIAPRTDLVVLG